MEKSFSFCLEGMVYTPLLMFEANTPSAWKKKLLLWEVTTQALEGTPRMETGRECGTVSGSC